MYSPKRNNFVNAVSSFVNMMVIEIVFYHLFSHWVSVEDVSYAIKYKWTLERVLFEEFVFRYVFRICIPEEFIPPLYVFYVYGTVSPNPAMLIRSFCIACALRYTKAEHGALIRIVANHYR